MKLSQSTKPQKKKNVKRLWHLIDAKNKVLGRISPDIAKFLIGKHKVNYVSYLDVGDYVVVINSKDVVVTGKKAEQKIYTDYSGYPGGQRRRTFQTVISSNPSEVIRRSVSGMLPKNKLRDRRLARLFVYVDKNHPYADKFTK